MRRWIRKADAGPPIGATLAIAITLLAAIPLAHSETAEGSLERGAKVFQACAACHSLQPGRHLTGPSLAGILGRKAGSDKSFRRYSDALLQSGIVWSEETLERWLADPAKLVPGNDMAFPGIKSADARRDLIAYLKSVADGYPPKRTQTGPRMPNLKSAQPDDVVKSVRYCGDTYFVTTESGKTHKLWEFNLRLKTDSSEFGPAPGKPVLIGVGMRGDRAAIVFSTPEEFSRFISSSC